MQKIINMENVKDKIQKAITTNQSRKKDQETRRFAFKQLVERIHFVTYSMSHSTI